MTLCERLLRQLDAAGAEGALLRLPPGVDWRARLRRDFSGRLPIVETDRAPDAREPLLVLDAATVYDRRVLDHLLRARANLRLSDGSAEVVGAGDAPPETLALADLAAYVPKIRQYQTPYALPVRDRLDLGHAERATFAAAYKGVTDVVTRYLYPRLVFAIVRALAPTRVTPNQVTALSMVLSFGAIPVFFLGHVGWGLAMGLVMSVLDSVDGKLARLTLRESKAGNFMDHGSDFVYLLLWLVAVGLRFAGVETTVVLTLAWLGDRGVLGLFEILRGRELSDYRPVDAAFRLVHLRRNVFLLILATGVVAGSVRGAVLATTAWVIAGLLFHVARFAWIVLTDEPPRASRFHGSPTC